jgi:hypothetical protein
MSGSDSPLSPFTAPLAEVVRRAAATMMPRLVRDLPCDRCGTTVARWFALSRCLCPPGSTSPLATDRREQVTVRCPQCGARWDISSRAVGRNLHNGRPPFG